jgi:hypothetical protein
LSTIVVSLLIYIGTAYVLRVREIGEVWNIYHP